MISRAINLTLVFAFGMAAIFHMSDDPVLGTLYLILAKLWLMDTPE